MLAAGGSAGWQCWPRGPLTTSSLPSPLGQVAKKDNLNAIQTELMKLEQSVHDIHVELQYIRRKEEQMRNINGAHTWGGVGGWGWGGGQAGLRGAGEGSGAARAPLDHGTDLRGGGGG